MFIETYPDELELLNFFEVEPEFSDPIEGKYAYRVSDNNNLTLIFSFAAVEGWIQTVLEYKGIIIHQCLSEGVKNFNIKDIEKKNIFFQK
ncbi:hypothetical protein [unidentified bacterial endosymbiont]|uniref:hypothetical protein n=1 Tax=unidentified bacterial endosymbiont TaxID=2355 RepID=UPI0020A087A2|nr:hypothetical protein [unidentified bacterial endosymbiont]